VLNCPHGAEVQRQEGKELAKWLRWSLLGLVPAVANQSDRR